MTNRQYLTGAQAVVATLCAHKVDTIFGLPGVHTLPLYDALRDEPSIRHVLARHEQGAGFMAEGYARVSGRPGVVCTITGPGVTNVATPVANAYADSTPLLVISSAAPLSSSGRARGELHEVKNQLGIMQAVTGWTYAVTRVEEIPEALSEALRVMRAGRPRGAYVQIPHDLLETSATVEIREPSAPPPMPPAEEDITRAIQLLRTARHPLIIAGAGVTSANANAVLQDLATLLHAPVILGSKSHDVLPTEHPLVLATNASLPPELCTFTEHSDVALVVGSKLGAERTADGRLPLPHKLIHIDIDATEIGRNYPAQVSIVADARLALTALYERLHAQPLHSSPRLEEIGRVRRALETSTRRAHGEAFHLLDGLRAGLPRDSILVADMTLLSYACAQSFPVYEPRTFIHPAEFCTIGCGLPLALGAQLAAPHRPVVALCGDGGFLLNASELATAVQERLPVIAVIFNDATFATVKQEQRERFDGRYIATDLIAPDYVTLAHAFHAEGIRVNSPQALCEALQTACQSAVPTIIDVTLPAQKW